MARRVVIAGAGVAGLEALLALRVRHAPQIDIRVLAPGHSFLYRPVSVAEAFGAGEAREFNLEAIFADQGVKRYPDTLSSVQVDERTLTTGAGAKLAYDDLVIALGARPVPSLPGALSFRGRADVPALRAIVSELQHGTIHRLAFALPGGSVWSLPLYELALMAAAFVSTHRLDASIALVTPEDQPLQLFGPAAGEAIRDLISARGIDLRTSCMPIAFEDGVLRLAGGAPIEADRVVALPRQRGPAIEGVPHDNEGFIPIDVHGRVIDAPHVYAAGDATTFPVKQGGLATQQADAIAETILAEAGVAIEPRPFAPVIRGLLLTGGVPLYLRAGARAGAHEATVAGERELEPLPGGHPSGRGSTYSTSALWWPPGKIAGRYLAPYLATARPQPLRGLEDRASAPGAISAEEHDDAVALALLLADNDARWSDYRMALHALDSAESLAGTLPPEYAAKRREWERLAGSHAA